MAIRGRRVNQVTAFQLTALGFWGAIFSLAAANQDLGWVAWVVGGLCGVLFVIGVVTLVRSHRRGVTLRE